MDSRTVATPKLIVLPRGDEEKPIILRVEGETVNGNVNYCIGRNTPLDCLLLDFAARFYEFYNHTIMICNVPRRRLVEKEDTADGIKLEDGDTIEMMTTIP
ncbi:hypothetical protein COLO4_20524 [Corchorus olitorius]|uniref:Rad60/SUMO-like domain-containing protein n=1 Tax=Corchorus olitorius TaxID=93759 RepID=A0A1R3IZB6_9ROSI|nr:hypothetical protein COLO4_20524 [Corchorus olitorius]